MLCYRFQKNFKRYSVESNQQRQDMMYPSVRRRPANHQPDSLFADQPQATGYSEQHGDSTLAQQVFTSIHPG